jgi:cytochrome o ubiquinol oxidase subunit II
VAVAHWFAGLGRNKHIPKLLALALTGAVGSGCSESILAPAGPVANGEQLILLDALGIMLVIVVPTILTTLWFAWWFRASNDAALYRPTWVYSDKLEVVVWCIPALTVLFLGGLAWIGSHRLDPARPLDSPVAPLEVQVVSLDWKWLFIYPDQHIASVNRLVLPVGRPVHLRLTSSSVMNVFFVPRLAGEIYTMNGMVTELNLQADKTGVYHGLSAQFSGDGFSGMGFNTEVVSASAFNQFVANTHTLPGNLDEDIYKNLSHPSQAVPVQLFGNVSGGLFESIVSRRLPAGEGPPMAGLAYGPAMGGH